MSSPISPPETNPNPQTDTSSDAPLPTFPYKFRIGNSVVVATCTVTVSRHSGRTVSDIQFHEPRGTGDVALNVSKREAVRVWRETIQYRLTKRSLKKEIERLTQAKVKEAI